MTNGNDYLEIEEEHRQEIFEAWIKTLDYDSVPDVFKTEWIDLYREGE